MSVAALFEGHVADVVGSKLIPVATEAVFEALWLPASRALGLRWVPLFQGGITLTSADVPDVLEELDRLREWVVEHGSEDVRDWWLDRIDRLGRAVRQVGAFPDARFWIG